METSLHVSNLNVVETSLNVNSNHLSDERNKEERLNLKKNLCNIFRFIDDDLNCSNDGGNLDLSIVKAMQKN